MFPRRNDTSFDWKGFFAAAKLFGALFLIGLGAYYGAAAVGFGTPIGSSTLALTSTAPPPIVASAISSTTPKRIINLLTIEDAIPEEGKLIAADLHGMKVYLYEDGTLVKEFPIQSKGRVGSPWETPSGMYAVQTKEVNHFSSIGRVYMPWSMQFYGNYFIHGWTTYPDGTPTSANFTGGCIKLLTEDAKAVYDFADIGTKVFVYDARTGPALKPLYLRPVPVPSLHADVYLVADIDTGDVYAEKNGQAPRPIASVTKLMTALVANETISFDKKITVKEGLLFNPPALDNAESKVFVAEDLVYPLLMQSSNGVADALAGYYGTNNFVAWMNRTAHALGMEHTTFADPSGMSAGNISTADDLFRLTHYLANKKSFILNVTHLKQKTIVAQDGTSYTIQNVNTPAELPPFTGGKRGHTMAAKDTMVSVMSLETGGEKRRIAVIVLGSDNQVIDTLALAAWVTQAASPNAEESMPACVGCTKEPEYRKIEL